ncbi:MAG: hypothetical protein FWF71_06470 [Actinomycetia bacterium]|nr:hypothetical protein [Actinomycetes bacterium]
MNELLLSLVFGVAVPVLAMAMLVPSLLDKAPKEPNFHGRLVFNGLGIVWLIWIVSIFAASQLACLLASPILLGQDSVWGDSQWLSLLLPAIPLLGGTVAFGLYDDWAGDSSTRGFRGHLSALARRRLTTGGLKMVGIGLLSLATGFVVFFNGTWQSAGKAVAAGAVLALSANLMNLFDLRPGRASKAYLLGLVLVMAVWAVSIAVGYFRLSAFGAVAVALACIGPLLATLRFDLREIGMLGDAGANSMGAVLGYLSVIALPGWTLAVLALVLLAFNLFAERISFSKVIDDTPWLRKLDDLGRKSKDG